MCFVCVFVVGSGTGMSHRAAMRCVWWCITNRPLLPVWAGSTCSSGTTTIAKPKTTSSANTLRVQLTQYFNIPLLWKYVNIVDRDSFFSTEKPLDPSPSPNSTQTSNMCSVWLLKTDILDTLTVWTSWMLFITDVFPSSVLPWNPTDPNQDRRTGWLTYYTLTSVMLSSPNADMTVTKSVSLCCLF